MYLLFQLLLFSSSFAFLPLFRWAFPTTKSESYPRANAWFSESLSMTPTTPILRAWALVWRASFHPAIHTPHQGALQPFQPWDRPQVCTCASRLTLQGLEFSTDTSALLRLPHAGGPGRLHIFRTLRAQTRHRCLWATTIQPSGGQCHQDKCKSAVSDGAVQASDS